MVVATQGLPCASVVMATTVAKQAMARALAAAMEWREVSQGELGRRVGIKQQAISKILAAEQRLYADQFLAICDALEVPADWLIRAAEGPAPSPDDFRLRAEIERIIALVGLGEAYRRLVVAAPAAVPQPRAGEKAPLVPDPPTPRGKRSGSA